MAYPALILIAASSLPCDWQVRREVDPMTDQAHCLISSASAHLGIGMRGDRVSFVSGSTYREHDALTIRIDDRPPVMLSRRGRNTGAYEPDARNVLDQILTGARIRVSYLDYPVNVSGEAAICNLPDLIRSCR